MELPKAKIEVSLSGKQTREIALSTIGRSSDKPLRTIAFMGLDIGKISDMQPQDQKGRKNNGRINRKRKSMGKGTWN